MTKLKHTLTRLESRLQAMIEGGAARLFPTDRAQKELVEHLIDTLQDYIEQSPGASQWAPNLFLIQMPSEAVQAFQEDQAFAVKLALDLEEDCQELGIHFLSQPEVKFQASNDVSLKGFRVSLQYSSDQLDNTSMIEVLPLESEASSLGSAFLIVNGSRIFTLTGAVINIGRHPDNNLVIDDPYISRNHAQLRFIRGQYVLFDLGSTSGTFVNGNKIKQHPLAPGDLILFAGIPVVFGLEAQSPLDQTQGLDNSSLQQASQGNQ